MTLKCPGDAVLTAVVDKEGVGTWINIPVKQLIAQGLYLGLIESAADQRLPTPLTKAPEKYIDPQASKDRKGIVVRNA
ncbi:hypothetical protein ACIQYF_20905 [Pseudomonas sp. NPDC096917]|uniref:hypothetical protein n=1 Tax=Pseudomonas sp. NPDC096917 TaxID=3364483 RepID=UPI00383AA9B2